MVCCLLELFISIMPIDRIKRIFPPIVTSITVILIGVALTGTGMKVRKPPVYEYALLLVVVVTHHRHSFYPSGTLL